jgi:hypothetical protein
MGDPDKNEQWLPIQIAPDECDLEPGRPYTPHWRPRDPGTRSACTYIRSARIGLNSAALILAPGFRSRSTVAFR